MVTIIFTFDVICVLFALLSFSMIGESFEMKEFLLYHLAQFIMHLEIACICFCISAFFKKVNIGFGLGVALILYFMDIMVKIIPDLKNMKYFTPFNYAGVGDIFGDGKIDNTLLTIGILTSIIFIIISFIKYMKKDMAA
jgi:ABC-2 type transport system permease protein